MTVELRYSLNSVFLCFQAATKESNAEERLTPVVLAQQAAQLKQQLVSAHLDSLLGPQAHINLADPDGALARLAEKRVEGQGDERTHGKGLVRSLRSIVGENSFYRALE